MRQLIIIAPATKEIAAISNKSLNSIATKFLIQNGKRIKVKTKTTKVKNPKIRLNKIVTGREKADIVNPIFFTNNSPAIGHAQFARARIMRKSISVEVMSLNLEYFY
jgi:hypothetical protein